MPVQRDLQLISGRLERGEIDSARYLEQLMRYVAAQIGCSRAGLRLLVDTPWGRAMRCVAMFDARLTRMVAAPDILHLEAGQYLLLLKRNGSVSMASAMTDPVSAGPLRDYLGEAGVVSLLDIGFSVNGVLFGAFTCEQIGKPTDWSPRQLQTLRQIASRASLTLMHGVNASIDTAPGALWEPSTPNRLATLPPLQDLPHDLPNDPRPN